MANSNLISLMDELIAMQQKKLLQLGRQTIPYLTEEDILQPNDYRELDHHPLFRYEEGVLIGMKTTKSAILAMMKDEKQ